MFFGPLNRPSLMFLARKDGETCSGSTHDNHPTLKGLAFVYPSACTARTEE